MNVSAATVQQDKSTSYEPKVGDLVSIWGTIGIITRIEREIIYVFVLIGTDEFPYARTLMLSVTVPTPWYGHLTLASRRDND